MLNLTLTEHEIVAARRLINEAFHEDLAGRADLTTNTLVPNDSQGLIHIVSRANGVLSGLQLAEMVFDTFDPHLKISKRLHDGDELKPGSMIAEVSGSMRSLLTAERTALNFLTMLSGTATLTRQFVDQIAGTSATILDTRKTLPGLRDLQKHAVRCGGGINHRMGLYDAVLIKDNHLGWWKASNSGTLADAVGHVRSQVTESTIIEIEVDNLEQFREVLPAFPSIILLDNMSTDQLRSAVNDRDQHAPNVLLEASGGVNLCTVRDIALTGVDRISVGALTHSAPALDIGFDWPAVG